ncbi:two-component sensor histidine kinase [Phenylobacterium haematophilum]|uniref:histidine kinase n=1 Tax=Phenylobacterium haematophilum TaxID=98513 RepID=A0A840A2R3_9CAUL|nr:sensor histidine kinase [Phenylobacterium haematophilum]MBB3891597.1 two-component sensor histidine kinase [Phenylobacterium haematophilum]
MTDDGQDDVRAAEMRHRAANTFQLISALARMRGQRTAEPEARRQLVWMADAIGALGALERHRRGDGVDFQAYLLEMAPVWRVRQAAGHTEVVVEAEPVIVPDQAASTLALIIHELVANALAHSYPEGGGGRVEVRLSKVGERYELVVRDHGRGFDPASPGGRERFGLWFVRSLAAQVRGELKLDTRGGVCAQLLFSL